MKKVFFICSLLFSMFAVPAFAELQNVAEKAGDFPSKADLFVERDPSGLVLTITAMAVVLSILLVLFIFFSLLGKLMKSIAKKKTIDSSAVKEKSSKKPKGDLSNGETIAAIAMALQMYQEDIHDHEYTVLTINKVARVYSPWNSKIYNMRQLPYKK